jgi:hypothetical protein
LKAIIISEPKSGTYLCSSLLKNLGLYQTYYHLFLVWYTAYEGDTPEKIMQGRNNPGKFYKKGLIEDMVKKIPEEGFAVTHLPKTQRLEKAFDGMKKVVVTRPFEEKEESNSLWIKETKRAHSSFEITHEAWLRDPETFHIEFNDMISINKEKIDALQIYLFGEVITDSVEAMTLALNEETITKSSKRREEQ